MSLFERIFTADVSISDLRNPKLWLLDAFSGQKTLAGVDIDPVRAMALPTYFACIRALSEDLAKLPLKVYRQLKPRGKEPLPGHPVYRLLHDTANPRMTAFTCRELLTQWQLGWGNGFAEIQRGGIRRTPVAMFPIHPSRVVVEQLPSKEIVYNVHNDDGRTVVIPQVDMFHLRGMGTELVGHSVVRLAAESLGLSLAAQSFGAAYFGNGAQIGGVLEPPGTLSEKGAAHLRESWSKMHQGVENACKTYLAQEGMTYKPLGVPPEEAQFIETRQFQVEDVCRWFRMPPHKVGHLLRAAGWSTLEATNTDYVTDTLMPHHVRWEQECKRRLFDPVREGDLFAEHVVAAMLRGDMTARSAYYREQFMIGALSQNEIRELENRNPIEGGDTYFVPMNMTASDVAADAEKSREADAAADKAAKRYRAAQAGVFLDVAERMVRKESKAVSRAETRFNGDADGYKAWADRFFAEHAEGMAQAFEAPAVALATLRATTQGYAFLPHGVGLAAGRAVQQYAGGYAEQWPVTPAPMKVAADVALAVTEAVTAELEKSNGYAENN